jgi:hypothetical protein
MTNPCGAIDLVVWLFMVMIEWWTKRNKRKKNEGILSNYSYTLARIVCCMTNKIDLE